MQFVRNAFKGRKDTRMLEVTLDIADSLMVPSIAEGVETAEQLFTLKALGCSIVQGYYFSRPIPAQDFEAFLLARRDMDADKAPIESPWRASGTRPKLHRVMHEKFTYEAMHDPLTGLYNHNAFDMLLKDADKNHIAVLIAEVNDSEALHTACDSEQLDRVAQRIAAVLRGSFRSVDFICRIRDEEYVIIMTRVDSSLIYLVEGKVAAINDRLMRPDEDLPPVSISVGVAFADRKSPQGAIYEDAEYALSRIREKPDQRCSIY
jgi:diguanylate cyclase (GGDEF)-like protein